MQELNNWIKERFKEPQVVEELNLALSSLRRLKRATTSARFARITPWQTLKRIYQLLVELDKLTSAWLSAYKEAVEEAHKEIFNFPDEEENPSVSPPPGDPWHVNRSVRSDDD
jgi:hypothetical protein